MLWVEEPYRGTGVGKSMLYEIIDRKLPVALGVLKDNRKAIKFYEAMKPHYEGYDYQQNMCIVIYGWNYDVVKNMGISRHRLLARIGRYLP